MEWDLAEMPWQSVRLTRLAGSQRGRPLHVAVLDMAWGERSRVA